MKNNAIVRKATLLEVKQLQKQMPEFAADYLEDNPKEFMEKKPVFFIAEIEKKPVGYLVGFTENQKAICLVSGIFPAYRKTVSLAIFQEPFKQWAMQNQLPVEETTP